MNTVFKKKENSYKNKSTQRAQFPKEGQSYTKTFMFYDIFITTR